MSYPSTRVRRGLIGGHKCPITDVEFTTQSGRRDELELLYQEQQRHTSAVMAEVDEHYGAKPMRSIEEYRLFWSDLQRKQAE